MKVKDNLRLKGRARLIAVHRKTGEKKVVETENLLLTVGRTWLLNYLVNAPDYTNGLTYCALGDDDTAVSEEQQTLVSEQIRRAFTQKDPILSGIEITLSTFFTAADSTFYIKEGGIFGHTATLAADSGVIWSRFLLDFDNTGGNYDVTVDYILTFEEGS